MKNIWKMMGVCALAFGVAGFVACKEPTPTDTPLTAPTGLNAEPTSDGANLSWNEVAGATGYKIQVDAGREQGPFGATNRKVTGLEPETTHTWRVCAVAGDVVGPWSNEEEFTVPELVLEAPTGLAVERATYNGFAAMWNVAQGEAEGYEFRLQGKFADGFNHPDLTDLGGGRKELKTKVLQSGISEQGWANGRWGLDLIGVLLPENLYTWSVRKVVGTKLGDLAEGPEHTTRAKIPPVIPYEGLLGNYAVGGTRADIAEGEFATSWASILDQAYYGQSKTQDAYLVMNLCNLAEVLKVKLPEVPAEEIDNIFGVILCEEDKYYLDDSFPIMDLDGEIWLSVGINGTSIVEINTMAHELTLEPTTKKFSFPAATAYGVMSFGIDAEGYLTVNGPLTEFYTNLTMTFNGTRAMMSGTKAHIDFNEIRIANDRFKVPVNNSKNIQGRFLRTSKYAETVARVK